MSVSRSRFLLSIGILIILINGFSKLQAEPRHPVRLIPGDTGLERARGKPTYQEALNPISQKKEIDKTTYIHQGLDKINLPLKSKVLRDILKRLVLEKIEPEEPVYLTGQKLSLLFELGYLSSFLKSIETLPEKERNESLMEKFFLAMCCSPSPNAEELARVADARYKETPTPFWRKAFIYANYLGKNKDKAELALNLWHDQGDKKESLFLELMNHVVYDTPVKHIKSPGLVELAVMRSTKIPVSWNQLHPQGILSIMAIAWSESLPLALRTRAAEEAVDKGTISPEFLQKLYERTSFAPDLLTQTQKYAKLPTQNLSAVEKRALLFQAAKLSAGEKRAELLKTLWKMTDGLSFESLAAVSYPLLNELIPDDELGWFAPDAVKALILFGTSPYIKTWIALAERESPELWLDISPLVFLSSLTDAEPIDTWFTRWYRLKETRDPIGAKNKALLLANLLNALRTPLKRDTLRDLDITFMSEAHPGILETMHSRTLEGKSMEEVIVSACKKLSKIQEQKDWIRLSQVVGKLYQFGLRQDARRLAIEIALNNNM